MILDRLEALGCDVTAEKEIVRVARQVEVLSGTRE